MADSRTCGHGNRAPTDVLRALYDSQAGAGRHKCVICAYARGVNAEGAGTPGETCAHGRWAPVSVLRDLPESQALAGVARHRCAVCAYHAGATLAEAVGEGEYPDEIDSDGQFPEGAKRTVVVNAFERNRAARARCIAHFGAECAVCGFDFERAFGEAGRGLIHVHHLRSLAEIGHGYHVDPIRDLTPVCPNCHAMIHRGEPMYTPDQLRQMIASRAAEGED